MASAEQKFPPQQQKTQPGKEHLMTPPPQFTSPDYKPSNKLQVGTYIYNLVFYYILFRIRWCAWTFCLFGELLLILYRKLDFLFQGKIALITGGDSGIGRAVSNLFSLEGATVAFTYVKGSEEKDAKETLEIIKRAKTAEAKDPMAIPTDLGYDENCKKVVEEVVSAFGRIDILINNAAEQYECGTVEDIDEPRLERVFRTNIFAYFFMAR